MKWSICINPAALQAVQSICASLYLFQLSAQASGKLLDCYKSKSVTKINFLKNMTLAMKN